ncbi:hypothetical protein [Streptomyces sp. NPDC058657]|uniref:hypothetical protein n=1 Tax=unclassified Streptomyces TaxID=2593676 RepID=UPI0036694B5A
MPSKESALETAYAAASDLYDQKQAADQNGGDPDLDTRFKAAVGLYVLVENTPDHNR